MWRFSFLFQFMDMNLRGWLDATLETANWSKHIRSSSSLAEVNVQQYFKDGYVSIFKIISILRL